MVEGNYIQQDQRDLKVYLEALQNIPQFFGFDETLMYTFFRIFHQYSYVTVDLCSVFVCMVCNYGLRNTLQ